MASKCLLFMFFATIYSTRIRFKSNAQIINVEVTNSSLLSETTKMVLNVRTTKFYLTKSVLTLVYKDTLHFTLNKMKNVWVCNLKF